MVARGGQWHLRPATHPPQPMPTQRAIDVFTLLNLAVIGLSLALQPRAWALFFAWMRREGDAGAVTYGLLCLLWGSLIVAFHRDWNGIMVIVPIFGAAQVLKGAIFLVAPGLGLRAMAILTQESPGILRLLGIISLVLAACSYAAYLPGGIF